MGNKIGLFSVENTCQMNAQEGIAKDTKEWIKIIESSSVLKICFDSVCTPISTVANETILDYKTLAEKKLT
jgi:hypothetical protein